MIKLLSVVILFFTATAFGQVNIVPQPVSLTMKTGAFEVAPATTIVFDKSTEKQAQYLKTFLQDNYGLTLSAVVNDKGGSAAKSAIIITFKKDGDRPDAYTLTSAAENLIIEGNTPAGVFYGIQTLLQLLPANHQLPDDKKMSIPALEIKDYPRFGYRGSMLDVGRHFFSADFVKQYINYLAYNKFNVFHWHLTEDQGWRIEIKKYPKLTSVGGFRSGTIIGHFPGTGNDNQPAGGFYTQQQIKEVVQYAADRFITIIPEIEMPGHSSAAIAAYPQLSCFPNQQTFIPQNMGSEASKKNPGKSVQESWGVFEDVYCPSEYTFKFLEDVLDEVLPLFPSKYIHIGGDESPKEAWKKSAFCQKLIKDKHLKDEHGLQSYFIQRVEKYINSKGKKIIGWDEILEGGLAPNATVMSWRGEQGGIDAAKQNHDVIMSPGSHCYLDHSQSEKADSLTIGGYLPLDKVYSYEPVPAALSTAQATHVLGAQVNVWTEYMVYPSKVEYMIFPRLSAFAEVVWSPKEQRSFTDFKKKLPAIFERYNFWKTNYNKVYPEGAAPAK